MEIARWFTTTRTSMVIPLDVETTIYKYDPNAAPNQQQKNNTNPAMCINSSRSSSTNASGGSFKEIVLGKRKLSQNAVIHSEPHKNKNHFLGIAKKMRMRCQSMDVAVCCFVLVSLICVVLPSWMLWQRTAFNGAHDLTETVANSIMVYILSIVSFFFVINTIHWLVLW
jgi:hypothetical protein